MRFYIAYGSNMDEEQMTFRCPGAKLIGTSTLKGYELLFRGSLSGNYATVEKKKGSTVPCLVWMITERDEENLDRYEGFPGFYYKDELPVEVNGHKVMAMIYIMHEERSRGLPSKRYAWILWNAYVKFGFDLEILRKAVEDSKEEKRCSE